MADLTLETITKGMEDGAETINANFNAVKVKVNADTADTGWQNIKLNAGYSCSDIRIAKYRKIGNHVYLRGEVVGKVGTVALLPYKPSSPTGFRCSQLSNVNEQTASMYVNGDGSLQLVSLAAADKGVWLNEISFLVD